LTQVGTRLIRGREGIPSRPLLVPAWGHLALGGPPFLGLRRPGLLNNAGAVAQRDLGTRPMLDGGLEGGACQQEVVHPGEVLVEVRAGGIVPMVDAVRVGTRVLAIEIESDARLFIEFLGTPTGSKEVRADISSRSPELAPLSRQH
jgi:hypothetical protein